jgi:hypothetical protein
MHPSPGRATSSRFRAAALALTALLSSTAPAVAQTFINGSIEAGSLHSDDVLIQSDSLALETRSVLAVLERSPTRLRFRAVWAAAVDPGLAGPGAEFESMLSGDARISYVFDSPTPFVIRVTAIVRGGITTFNDGLTNGQNDVAEGTMSDVRLNGLFLVGSATTRGPTTASGVTSISTSGFRLVTESAGTGQSGDLSIRWNFDCASRIVGLAGNGVECAGRFGLLSMLTDTRAAEYPGIGDRDGSEDGIFITLDIVGPVDTPTPPPTITPTSTPTRPVDGLSIDDVAILEGDSGTRSAVFTVSLRGRRSDPVSVGVRTFPGSATAGTDYGPQSATLVFGPLEIQKLFSVPVFGDRTLEPNETFTVALSNAVGAPIGDGVGVGTILTDEGLGVGVAELSPADPVTAPGELTELTLRWVHPQRWRALNTVDLRLIDGDQPVFWARFDEAANTLAPCTADGACGTGLAPGTGAPIDVDAATFYPARSAVQGSGPTGPSVDLTFAFSLDRSLGGHVLRVESAATDDSGATQDFQPIGYLEVMDTSVSGSDNNGCAVQPPRRRAAPGVGALVVGLLVLVILRRRR